MFSIFTKAIDRVVIELARRAQPKAGTFENHLEEAAALLAAEDFFGGSINPPDAVHWASSEDLYFDSSINSPWQCNNRVHAKLQRCAFDWQNHPTVLLVHGWNDEIGYALRHPFQAKRLLKAGVNVAQIQLPYHMERRPRKAGEVNDFLTEDLRCTVLAAKQAVTDIRTLLAWLQQEGCTRTGLLGVSLGGWLTGLVASHDENVKFAVLNVPVARMDRVVSDLPFAEPLRRALQAAVTKNLTIDFEKLNLRGYKPKPASDKILIIEAVDDLFASKEAIEEFWGAWGQPEIWRVNHAHISGLFSPRLLKRQVAWIARKSGAIT